MREEVTRRPGIQSKETPLSPRNTAPSCECGSLLQLRARRHQKGHLAHAVVTGEAMEQHTENWVPVKVLTPHWKSQEADPGTEKLAGEPMHEAY